MQHTALSRKRSDRNRKSGEEELNAQADAESEQSAENKAAGGHVRSSSYGSATGISSEESDEFGDTSTRSSDDSQQMEMFDPTLKRPFIIKTRGGGGGGSGRSDAPVVRRGSYRDKVKKMESLKEEDADSFNRPDMFRSSGKSVSRYTSMRYSIKNRYPLHEEKLTLGQGEK